MKKQNKRLGISVILLVIFSTIGFQLVKAWIVSTPYWNISSSTVVNYRADQLPTDFQNRLSDARSSWNSVSPARIDLIRNDTTYALRVYDGYIDGTGGTLGVTNRYYTGDTFITYATTKIETSDNWYTGTGSPGGTQNDLQSLLAHELGHALAIKHTNASCPVNSTRPTMCSGQPPGTNYMRSLEADDKNALNYLYP